MPFRAELRQQLASKSRQERKQIGLTITSPEAHASKLTMEAEQGSKKEKIVMESSAKWLSAECGSPRPTGSKSQ